MRDTPEYDRGYYEGMLHAAWLVAQTSWWTSKKKLSESLVYAAEVYKPKVNNDNI